MSLLWILIIVLVVIVGWVISTYNFFVSSKARIKAAIQEIGNQLKRQADLIPNLESSAKGYLKHETGVYEKLTEARKAIAGAIKSVASWLRLFLTFRSLLRVIPNLRHLK